MESASATRVGAGILSEIEETSLEEVRRSRCDFLRFFWGSQAGLYPAEGVLDGSGRKTFVCQRMLFA